MTFQTLVESLVRDTVDDSLPFFRPELVLCGTIVLMLLLRVFDWTRKIDAFYLALVGAVLALWYSIPAAGLGDISAANPSHEIFTGMLVYDSLTTYVRALLMFFAVLLIVLTRITGLTDHQDGPDFYSLLLGATIGMCIMASSNHLLMVFLGVEMASVPSYVLAGSLRGRTKSSEAALKYAIYGAGAAGVMLYGISLLCGALGSAHLPTLAAQLADMDIAQLVAKGEGTEVVAVLALGGLMVMVGLAFKLSAVPFHFWCPDVFEGASAEVAAFLSVASKAAALALLVRVSFGLGTPDPNQLAPLDASAQAQTDAAGPFSLAVNRRNRSVQGTDSDRHAVPPNPIHTVASETADQEKSSDGQATGPLAALAPVRQFMILLIALIAAVTCTFGNLAAYGQTNIKRMLAYSTIAHAGYMMMPVAAGLSLVSSDATLAREAISALVFYVTLYLFMNLGAFAVVAVLRCEMGSESIEDYAGLIRSCPVTVVCFSIILFSLVGLPPLAGFVGKFAIFVSLVKAGGPVMIGLLFVAGVNTAISLVYYLNVVKVMTIDPEPDSRRPMSIRFIPTTYLVAVSLPVLVLGIWWGDIYRWANAASANLFF